MDFLTNKKTGEVFPTNSNSFSSTDFHNKDSDVIESGINNEKYESILDEIAHQQFGKYNNYDSLSDDNKAIVRAMAEMGTEFYGKPKFENKNNQIPDETYREIVDAEKNGFEGFDVGRGEKVHVYQDIKIHPNFNKEGMIAVSGIHNGKRIYKILGKADTTHYKMDDTGYIFKELDKTREEHDRLWHKVFGKGSPNGGKEYKDALDAYEKYNKENLVPLNQEKYTDINVLEITDPKEREKHQGYRFLVHEGTSNHSAFMTREGLDKFVKDKGLKLKPVENIFGYSPAWEAEGTYRKVWLSGDSKMLDEFAKKHDLIRSEEMDNGDFTRAYIQKGSHGNTIFLLNPNYDREELPYHSD